jgi:hypothetical protein
MTKKLPLACEAVTDDIKRYIKQTGKCKFQFDERIGIPYCHFVYEPECGHFGRLLGFDKEMGREYYRCEL